jgi:hypothetical protein
MPQDGAGYRTKEAAQLKSRDANVVSISDTFMPCHCASSFVVLQVAFTHVLAEAAFHAAFQQQRLNSPPGRS